jgi:hypothetical protein
VTTLARSSDERAFFIFTCLRAASEDEMIRRWSLIWVALSAGPLLAVLASAGGWHAVPRDRYAAAYAVRLTSDWPVYPGESEACNNSGDEVLEGTVRRVATERYAGRFARINRLGFCGAHGRDQATACTLRLEGHDSVDVEAVAFDEGRGPELRVWWHSAPATGAATVEGTCSERFEAAMRRMYADAVQEVELSVADAFVGRGSVRLDDYPWTAAITRLRAMDTLDLPSSRPAAGP